MGGSTLPEADPRTAHRHGDARIALILGLLAYAFVAWHARGIVSSNDGSSFALTRALAVRGTATIGGFHAYTAGVDLAYRGGEVLSDRAPFTAIAAVPFHVGARALARIGGATPLVEPAGPPGEFGPMPTFPVDAPEVRGALLVAHLAFALTVGILFLACRRIGAGRGAAAFVVGLYALGTVASKYGTVLFTHGPAAALVLAAALLTADAPRRGLGRGLAAGLVLGVLPGTEHAALALVPLLAVIPFACATRFDRTWRRTALGLALGLVPGAVVLAIYNTALFGAPWLSGHAHNLQFPWTRDPREAFGGELGTGLRGLLFGGPTRGWFVSNPLLVLWPLGSILLLRRGTRVFAALTAIVPLAFLLLIAKHRTYAGGATSDTRYLLPVLPLVVLAIAPVADVVVARAARSVAWFAVATVGVALLAWSALHHYIGMRLLLLDAWSPEALLFGPGFAIARADLAGLAVLLPHLALLGALAVVVSVVARLVPATRSLFPWLRAAGWGIAAAAVGVVCTLVVPGALVATTGF